MKKTMSTTKSSALFYPYYCKMIAGNSKYEGYTRGVSYLYCAQTKGAKSIKWKMSRCRLLETILFSVIVNHYSSLLIGGNGSPLPLSYEKIFAKVGGVLFQLRALYTTESLVQHATWPLVFATGAVLAAHFSCHLDSALTFMTQRQINKGGLHVFR